MSKENLYSIFDSKANTYGMVFGSVSDGVAHRMFLSAVASGNSDISRYPEDFYLFCIGSFDDTTGILDPSVAPRMVVSGVSVLQALRGAAVGGVTPLKPQSDHESNSTEPPLEDTFSDDNNNDAPVKSIKEVTE